MPARTIHEVLANYRMALERVDPTGLMRERQQEYFRDGGKVDQLQGDNLFFYRLTYYLRFLEREDRRIAQFPGQLRPIALAEPLDNEVRSEALVHIQKCQPQQAYLELRNPFPTAPDAARVRTLRCGDPVRSTAWSPTRHLLAASCENNIIIWDVATGQPMGEPLQGHTEVVTSLSWSPDGHFLASGSFDDTVVIWNWETGQQQTCQPLREYTRRGVNAVSWSPDGRFLASGIFEGTIIIRDAKTGLLVCEPLRGHTSSVDSLSWHPTNRRHVASGSRDGKVMIWDAETGRRSVAPLYWHLAPVSSVSWSPDGNFLASGNADGTIVVWNTMSWERVSKPLRGHSREGDGQVFITWSPDGNFLASGGEEGTIIIWNATTWHRIGVLRGHTYSVNSLSWLTAHPHLLASGGDGNVIIWDVEKIQKKKGFIGLSSG